MLMAASPLSPQLRFPVPEFMLAVGFLFLLVMESLILTLRDECERQHGQKEGREEKEALLLCSPTPRPDPTLSPIRSFVLVLSLSLFSTFQSFSVGVVRLRPDLLLRTSLITCSLVFLLAQSQMRRSVVSICLVALSSAFPLSLVLHHTHTHSPLRLACSTLEGLSVGSFTYVVFMDVIPRAMSASEHRIGRVTLILMGFSVLTAALLLRT